MNLQTDFNYDSNTISILNKNITSLNESIKSKTFLEELVRINHFFIHETMNFNNVDEYRFQSIAYEHEDIPNKIGYLSEEDKKKQYNNEEDLIVCGKFPHLNYCGCKFPCSLIMSKIQPIEVFENLFGGPIECAYKTKELLGKKITHILNLSCTEYYKRHKYFNYLDIFINDNHTENAIKFFKITNRFIDQAIKAGKRVLVHSVNGKSRCWIFIIAYLIGRKNMKFHEAMELVREKFPKVESNDNFYTQLKHYDLETNK